MQKGDRVKVLSKLNDDWLFGESAGGATGAFPAAFVDRMPHALPLHEPPASDAGTQQVARQPTAKGSGAEVTSDGHTSGGMRIGDV